MPFSSECQHLSYNLTKRSKWQLSGDANVLLTYCLQLKVIVRAKSILVKWLVIYVYDY